MRPLALLPLIALAACERSSPDEKRPPSPSPPAISPPRPAPPTKRPAPNVLGISHGEPRAVPGGVVWATEPIPAPPGIPKGVFLPDDGEHPRDATAEELAAAFGGPRQVQRRTRRSTSEGPFELRVVDAGGEHLITRDLMEADSSIIVGDEVIWTHSVRDGVDEVLRRPIAGGRTTRLASRYVYDMTHDGRDVFASSSDGLLAFDLVDGRTRVIAADAKDVTEVVAVGDRIYWVEEGDPYANAPPSGRVRSAPRGGGPIETLAERVDHPWMLAVDTTDVYFASVVTSAVWRVPRAGGTPQELVAAGDESGGAFWLHRSARGLIVTRLEDGPNFYDEPHQVVSIELPTAR